MSGRSIGAWAGLRRISAAAVAATALVPAVAHAEVRLDGDWSDDPEVSLDVDDVPRAEAVNRIAAAAGWSVVINAPRGDHVTLHVKDQPASKVLDLVLSDGRYVARRDDTLLAVSPDDAPRPSAAPMMPPMPPMPPLPPLPALPALPPLSTGMADGDGRDRLVTGGNLRINAGEVVHDVTVMGGNLDVWGTVTGDLQVMGGNVTLHRGAHVRGDAAAVGGNLTLESGADVGGDVGVVGGELRRDDGARVRGEVREGVHKDGHHRHRDHAARSSGPPARDAASSPAPGHDAGADASSTSRGGRLGKLAHEAIAALNGAALLFVFGAVLLALVPERMDKLRVQIAAHPMRSFATGVVSLLAGVVLAAAVSLTVIGIPFVLVGILLAIVGTLAGLCSVLETLGGALLAHRTKNPYVHLACGALILLVAGAIPIVGPLLKLAVVLTALGSVVATRAAGLVPAKARFGAPYAQPVT